jgi:hypothetical protein
MDMKKRLSEPRQAMNPMDALSKMIEQNRPKPPEPPPALDPRYPDVIPFTPDTMSPARVDPMETQRPEVYPQDYVSPLSAVSQPSQPRTSYTQDESGNQVEIGYDGQPISGYSPEKMAIHNAIMGITPSDSQYVWNGQGYDKVPLVTPQTPQVGGVTLSNGQFIGGYENPNGGMEIGTPSFFQQYAGNPDLMSALSDAYGYDVSNPDAIAKAQGQPQTGYNPIPNPEIGYNPDPNPVNGNNNSNNDFQKMMEDMRMQDRIKQTMEEIEPTRPNKQYDEPDDNIGRRLG